MALWWKAEGAHRLPIAELEKAAERAETAAAKAEALSKNAPKIQNGNWWVYNPASGQYEDSGQKAQGAQGEQGDPGPAGAKGDPGQAGAPGQAGTPGVNGIDGFSPTVQTAPAEGGTTVTITDREGAKVFTVKNGAKGDRGERGETGAQGARGEQGEPGAKGDKGDPGQAASLRVGSVQTGQAGTQAQVTNSGTAREAVLNFVIPRGEKGDKGEKGDTGPQGVQGPPGAAAQGSKRTARFVVGTSTAGWTAADCDYLCDGTDDQVEINAAIQALPANGGEVVVLDGTYNITASITMTKNNTKLTGNGTATCLQATLNNADVITLNRAHNCTITGLKFDMRNCSRTTTAIALDSLADAIISKNFFDAPTNALYVSEVKRCSITENIIYNCTASGIIVTTMNNSEIIISSNIVNTSFADTAIRAGAGKNIIVANNTCTGAIQGIEVTSVSNSMIIGNTCIDCDTGIGISYANNSNISGNITIYGSGTSADYERGRETIKIDSKSKNNLVCNNHCSGKAPTDSGTNNTLANNKY